MKTCAFVTVGCKVNQYETELIREQFLHCGFKEVDFNQPADYYFINTCTVTHHSDRDCRNLIRRSHSANPQAKIIAAGCYVDRDFTAIKDLGIVKYIVPNSKKSEILKIISGQEIILPSAISEFKKHDRAFVKVQDGCNNFCSYCIVPFVRGRSRSLILSQIRDEVQALVKNDYLEVVLCGVCLGDYGKDNDQTIVDLLKSLVEIKGEFRIRLSSIEPKDISDGLIDMMANSDKICRHLHLPFQSGDDEILKLMNRPYTHKKLASLCNKLYKKIPSLCISADIIVGFPNETEKNFKNTLRLLKETRPQRTHIFPYSRRPGTKAAEFANRVSTEVIKKRVATLKELSQGLSYICRKRFLNKNLRVLIESQLTSENLAIGYSDNYIAIKMEARNIKRPSLINAKIKKVDFSSTMGEVVSI